MNDTFLILSMMFSLAIGGIAFIAVTKNHRSPNCLILLFTLLFGNVLPMIAEIYLFNLGWSSWWWLILVNNFVVVPILGQILAVFILSVAGLEFGTIVSLIASIVFLWLGIK